MKNKHPDSISRSFCSLAFNQLHVSPMGNVKPCCIYDGIIKSDDGSTLRISDGTIEEIWNNSHLKEVRQKMLRGDVVPECAKCMEEEKVCASSDRIRAFETSPRLEPLIEHARKNGGEVKALPPILNLKIGNLCNLKCRMCQPLDSSSIDTEFSQISKDNPLIRNFDNASAFDYYFDSEPIETAANWITLPQANLNIQRLLDGTIHLALAGGEVAYTQEAISLLKYCVEKNISKNIKVSLSSNLTRVTSDFINLLAAFRQTTVSASIDGVGSVSEYIRYPSKWNIVRENFIKFLHAPANIIPVIAPTFQIYNILDAVEILQLAEDLRLEMENSKFNKWEYQSPFHLTILYTPQLLSIRHLPENIKLIAYKKLLQFSEKSYYYKKNSLYQNQLNLLLETLKQPTEGDGEYSANEYLAHFLQYSEILDAHRKQSMKESLPELYQLLAETGIKPAYPGLHKRSYSYYRYRDVGFSFHRVGDFDKALTMFNKAYCLYQDDEHLLFSMGQVFKTLNQGPKAQDFFRKVYAISPQHYYNLVELGRLLIEASQQSEAVKILQEATRVEPSEKHGEADQLIASIS